MSLENNKSELDPGQSNPTKPERKKVSRGKKIWAAIGVATVGIGATAGIISSKGGDNSGENLQTTKPPATAEAPVTPVTQSPETPNTPEPVEAINPEMMTQIENLLEIDFDIYKEKPIEERLMLCNYVNRDLATESVHWSTASGNSLDTLPEETSTNTPQEIVQINSWTARGAYIEHYYPEDGGEKTELDIETSRKIVNCVFVDGSSENAIIADNLLKENNIYPQISMTSDFFGANGAYVMPTVESYDEEQLKNGYQELGITTSTPTNGILTHNYTRIITIDTYGNQKISYARDD